MSCRCYNLVYIVLGVFLTWVLCSVITWIWNVPRTVCWFVDFNGLLEVIPLRLSGTQNKLILMFKLYSVLTNKKHYKYKVHSSSSLKFGLMLVGCLSSQTSSYLPKTCCIDYAKLPLGVNECVNVVLCDLLVIYLGCNPALMSSVPGIKPLGWMYGWIWGDGGNMGGWIIRWMDGWVVGFYYKCLPTLVIVICKWSSNAHPGSV